VPDFGGQPIGCQGKIDFLFVISSWYSMKANQVQLQEAFPAFTAMLEDEFADFDYHIMVVDAVWSNAMHQHLRRLLRLHRLHEARLCGVRRPRGLPLQGAVRGVRRDRAARG
jgi:hypothetical protein